MKVLIAGLGLIGGSFALALRDHGIAEEILGVESSEEHAAEALQLGLADRIVSFEEGVPEADLVVLATPVDTIPLMAVKALNRAGGCVVALGSVPSAGAGKAAQGMQGLIFSKKSFFFTSSPTVV